MIDKEEVASWEDRRRIRTGNTDWNTVFIEMFLEEAGGTVVYAYASNGIMTPLSLGDTTPALTDQMSMINISNADYAAIDDINFTITGYGIGTEEGTTDPNEAWVYCKEIGELRQSS